MTALNDKFQQGLDESVKKQLNERRVKELVELMMPPSRDLSEAEKQGRKTGSLQVGRNTIYSHGRFAFLGFCFW